MDNVKGEGNTSRPPKDTEAFLKIDITAMIISLVIEIPPFPH